MSLELSEKAPTAPEVLEKGIFDTTAVLAVPEKYRERLRKTNMLERLIQKIRRREKVIRIFPNKSSAWRLVGALLAEKHEEWSTGRRYLKIDGYYEWRKTPTEENSEKLPANKTNALYNLPDRRSALNKKTDVVCGGGRWIGDQISLGLDRRSTCIESWKGVKNKAYIELAFSN